MCRPHSASLSFRCRYTRRCRLKCGRTRSRRCGRASQARCLRGGGYGEDTSLAHKLRRSLDYPVKYHVAAAAEQCARHVMLMLACSFDHSPSSSFISTTSTFSMSHIGPQSTVSALQARSGLRQSWHLPSNLHGTFLSKRARFCTAATFLAR